MQRAEEGRRNGGVGRREKDVGKHRVPKVCGKRRARTSPEGWGLPGVPGRRRGAEGCRGMGRKGKSPEGEGVGVTHSGVPLDMPGEHASKQGALHGEGVGKVQLQW